MNQHTFDGFYDEMMKIAQGPAGAVTKVLRGVLTRDPRAAWRTGSHAMRRSQRLAKADVLRAERGARQTGGVEKLLAEGKVSKQQAAEMMKHRRPSPPVRQLPRTEEGTRSIMRPAPKPAPSYAPRAERTTVSAPRRVAASPYAATPRRGGVMERVGKLYEGMTPGQRMGLRIGGTALGAGGLGYGLG